MCSRSYQSWNSSSGAAEKSIAAIRMPFAIASSRTDHVSLPRSVALFQRIPDLRYHEIVPAEEATMTATTPSLKHAEKLGPLASRYVEVEGLPWKPTPCPGIDMKVLLEDPETGLLTALFRWQPGSELALHEHVEIEQTFVLEGS